MGATNNNESRGTVIFYKLKEDKTDGSKTKNQLRFYKQTKDGEVWKDGEAFSGMEGHLTNIATKSYEWQGKQKDVFEFELTDSDGVKSVISLGLDSNISRQILNTFAGEENLGEISFQCGAAKEFKNKYYPTLYINNNGNKTTWKYSNANNNMSEIPQITSKTDEDGNNIRTGVKANVDFWKGVIDEIKATLAPVSAKDRASEPSQKDRILDENAANSENIDEDNLDLPF